MAIIGNGGDNGYMAHLFDFLKRLEFNNNREWFQANKSEYDELRGLWMQDVARLIERMSAYDESLKGVDVKDCVYRIYRDIRFSPNKLPYKTYFSAVIAQGGRKTLKGCCYLHVQPGGSGLHGGIWCPEMPLLTQLRHEVDDNIEEFMDIINADEFKKRYHMSGDSLKTMPKGFPKDLPHGDYVKYKEYLVSMPVSDSYFTQGDWVEKVSEDFRYLKPFNDFLNYVFD